MTQKQRKMLLRIIIAAVLTAVLALLPDITVLPFGHIAKGLIYYLAVYLLIGYDILRKAALGIRNSRVFDENFLMVVATVGAFALALYEQSGDYLEAIAVMLFYQVGEFFQSYAVGKSRRSITALMDIRPDYANIETADGTLQRTDPDDVEPGQTIVVQPGENVPIDGIVLSGSSSLNTAALTGESLPREVSEGDEIISGSINMTGVLHIRTTKEFGESTVSKILELVEDSASHKSRSEDFITRFARIYTPAVCYAALALAFLPPLIEWGITLLTPHFTLHTPPFTLHTPPSTLFTPWLYRALIFLVISCPCALVVSIPLSFFAGIGGASRDGILVKGANILETLAKVKTVVVDKTGTLTLGVFDVTAMHDNDDADKTDEAEKRRLIELAALTECASLHPISKSLRRAYGQPIDHSRVSDIREISGEGITAVVDGQPVGVGNEKLMQRLGVEACHCHSAGTIVHIAADGTYLGHIVLGDVVKPHAAEALQALKHTGVRQTVMLTGDSRKVAEEVAQQLGVDTVYSELLPADKVARVTDLLATQPKNERLAFVGDGINDAPVLTRANVGIAMGGLGSDAAIEAADVVLMDDDPLKIAHAIRLSRRTLRIVWQNITMALGIKAACLVLGALGIANMWLAIFADVGVLILAVLNAIRAMAPVRT